MQQYITGLSVRKQTDDEFLVFINHWDFSCGMLYILSYLAYISTNMYESTHHQSTGYHHR